MFTLEDVRNVPVEDLYRSLVAAGNGGVKVRSNAAPALSTEFVRTRYESRVSATDVGAFAEISYPSLEEIEQRHIRKHGTNRSFTYGYMHTYASDAFPAGYGERSAKALAKEESTYQLKGTFPTAAIAYAKLRARLEARDGDVDALDSIFTEFWGLESGVVQALPRLHLDGSEATRAAAMEDRAYHALAGHPGHHGGYRIDTATIAPNAVGDNVPINWPRLRTGLKAIAHVQSQGDLTTAKAITHMRQVQKVKFTMSFVEGSQPEYVRSSKWETLLKEIIVPKREVEQIRATLDFLTHSTMSSFRRRKFLSDETLHVSEQVRAIAKIVTRFSTQSITKTIAVISALGDERALMAQLTEAELDDFANSELTKSFRIPRYKLTRESLRLGVKKPYIDTDDLPDIRSFDPVAHQLNFRELREAHMTHALTISGALNLAVYITCMHHQVRPYAYQLMHMVKAPEGLGKAAIALRQQKLYEERRVRALGPSLFGEVFQNNLDLIIKNLIEVEDKAENNIKKMIWEYLSHRTTPRRGCPFKGGWRDLISELHTAPEGWTLYYWMRVTHGKKHHAITDGILAPMAAGERLDLLTLMKRSITERARAWSDFYGAKHQVMVGTAHDSRERVKELKALSEEQPSGKYLHPYARVEMDLRQLEKMERILAYSRDFDPDQYKKMVELQCKAKFFSLLQVHTSGNRLVVGIDDDVMRDMYVEFYRQRWFSLETRITKAQLEGEVFKLGPYEFETHPWGKLQENLPDYTDGVLEFMRSLDWRAWTVEPTVIRDKLAESLGELWMDVHEEMGKVVSYINDLHEGLVEMQDIANEAADPEHPERALVGIPAIPIPSFGYTAPFQLPKRVTTVHSEENVVQIPQSSSAFVKQKEPEVEEGGPPVVEFDTPFQFIPMKSVNLDPVQAPRVEYLTYRDIWHYLALPEKSDAEMRFVMGLPSDTDIDSQHVNSDFGPLMMRGEEMLVRRRWNSRMSMFDYRLGHITSQSFADDM